MKKTTFISTALLSITIGFSSCDFLDDFGGGRTLPKETSPDPIVIAHRGAQSVYPEHTIEAYTRAIELGADFIEPDLVMTKDSVLIARHEPFMSGTTNVSDLPQFANLRTTKNLDGKEVTDWFASDFTLAEIKQLRARQARADRSDQFDDLFEVPTFEEIVTLAQSRMTTKGKEVGIYPEMKHPLFHNDLSLPIEDTTLEVLEAAGWNSEDAPVFVQCFEVAPLQYINTLSTIKLVQLISTYTINADGSLDYNVPAGDFISFGAPYDFFRNGDTRTYEFFTTEEGMRFTATYADGIGPWKPFIISLLTTADGSRVPLPETDFVDLAHENNLLVHPYTFRNEDEQWSGGNPELEYHLFFDAGVDGIFSDYTEEAVNAVTTWERSEK